MIYREPSIFVSLEKTNSYLNFRHCGVDYVPPEYCYGPSIRDFYLIHYIMSGTGTYVVNNEIYHLSKGDAFIVKPNEITSQRADANDPWSFCFFAFDGAHAEELLSRTLFRDGNYIVHLYDTPMDDLFNLIVHTVDTLDQNKANEDILALSQLLKMLHLFSFIPNPDQLGMLTESALSDPIRRSLDFIHLNYATSISISGIAAMLSLNRSYFYRLFKKETGISPVEYLNRYRLEKARLFLANTKMPISQIALSTGFSSFSSFHRLFRIKYGQSPSEYRKAFLFTNDTSTALGSR